MSVDQIMYVICTTPRTRASILCQTLCKVEGADYPFEYLPGETPLDFFESKKEGNVFGVKVVYNHLLDFTGHIDIFDSKVKFIWFRRLNKVQQSISVLKGIKKRLFWSASAPPENEDIDVSHKEISYYTSQYTLYDCYWKDFFDKLGCEPLEIWCDELGTPEARMLTINRLLEFCEIPMSMSKPIEIMSVSQNSEWNDSVYRDFIRSHCLAHDGLSYLG